MKLLVEGIDHEGALRFSDTVPYNDAMLAAITRTDIDSAICCKDFPRVRHDGHS